MKKLLFILILTLISMSVPAKKSSPFAGKTKHKTVKKMSKRQVKNAQKGKTFYHMKRGKIRKRRF